MKGAPWFPFYPADFLGGTFAMDAAEVGAYVRLLCLQWQGGGLPNDPAKLAALSGNTFVSAIADKFVRCEDGKLRNLRLEEYRERASKKSASATAAINKRWGAKPEGNTNEHTDVSTNEHTDVILGQRSEVRGQNTEDREQSSTPQPPAKREAVVDDPDAGYPEDFLAFWKAFPAIRKKNKGITLRKWKDARKKRSAEFIMQSLSDHKAFCADWLRGDGKFIPGPEVWLNKGSYDATFDRVKPFIEDEGRPF